MKDPIVAEVRRVRERLAAKADYDIKTIVRSLQKAEKRSGRKAIRLPPKRFDPVAESSLVK